MTPRVVFDSMVYLQQAARPARVHASFRAVREGLAELHASEEVLAEVRDILTRPKHRAKFPALTPEHVARFIEDVRSFAAVAPSVPRVFGVPGHPDDDHVFNLAILARAHFLVTWESRILGLPDAHPVAFRLLLERAPLLRIVDPPAFARAVTPPPP